MRITAQLIDARSDTHLWSETYDRPLDDIFAVQDEIAAAVVAQLKLKLLGAAPKAKAVDPTAYALYLQARQLWPQSTPEGLEQSIALYQQALAIDANDAAAWSGLASGYISQAGDGLRPIEEGYRLAREAVDKALAIDPDYAPAYGLLGRIAMEYDGDLAAAARHLEHALALEPTNTEIIRIAAYLARSLGRLDTAIALGEYVIARDPVNAVGYVNLGYQYSYAGRLDAAIESRRTALSLSPDYGGAQYLIGVALLLKGDPAGALAAMQKESSESWRLIGLPMAWHALGKQVESDAALAELIRRKDEQSWSYNIAYVHGLPRRGRPRLRVAGQGGCVPRHGPDRNRGRPVVGQSPPGPALVAVPAQARQGAGAVGRHQVRREAAAVAAWPDAPPVSVNWRSGCASVRRLPWRQGSLERPEGAHTLPPGSSRTNGHAAFFRREGEKQAGCCELTRPLKQGNSAHVSNQPIRTWLRPGTNRGFHDGNTHLSNHGRVVAHDRFRACRCRDPGGQCDP